VLLNASQYQENPAGEWIMVGDQNVQPHLSKACDVALLFETSACRYFVTEPIAPPNLTTNVWPVPPPNWWTTNALQRVAHTIYASHNAEDMRRVIALSNQRGPAAGYMFVVDSESAIYNHLPPYWTEELAAITVPLGTATAEQRSNATSKFYVRDWTDTRNIHDTGQEPSTHVFWVTSDVWNRQTNSSGADPLNPTKFSGNDQPPSEDIQVGTTLPIPNFAFVRIHRQYACAGTPAATVPATFLWADFGTGTNFQDVSSNPTEQVGFASGDVRKINFGVEWTLPAANSGHICLAVEIDTGQDPLKVELKGRSTSDVDSLSLVVKDNNLAQRNLAAVAVANLKGNLPAEGLLPFCFYGIAHNGDIFPRTMVLRCELAEEVQGILGDAFVEVIEGSDEPTSRSCKLGGTIMLEDMQPGENRWIGLSAQLRGGDEGQLLPVSFRELINDEVVNGFTIAVKPAVLSTVMLDNLNLQATEFYRLADTFGIESAEEVSEAALEVFRKSEELTSDAYLEFLQSYLALMSEGIDDWIRSQDVGDAFGIRAALEQLTEGLKSDDIALVTATHNCALQKLDAFITMRQKAQGDDADILQMVRWQQRLYSRQPLEALEGAGQIVEESERFVDAYQAREIGNDEYPRLIHSLLDTFRQTSEVGIDLEKDTTAMQQCMESPAGLQKAHREYLLKLQYLLKLNRLGIKV
jgi:hypothetical protein